MKINPKPTRRRGEPVLTLTEKDWKRITREGGQIVLSQVEDFDGSVSAAEGEARRELTARMGSWSCSSDTKNGTLTINLEPPTE